VSPVMFRFFRMLLFGWAFWVKELEVLVLRRN
jgi:hypothetical protein